MDVERAAKNTLAYIGDTEPSRASKGDTLQHAAWMLHGIILGYVQHEKAHRWLGYAQAILVLSAVISLSDAKRINKHAARPRQSETVTEGQTDG